MCVCLCARHFPLGDRSPRGAPGTRESRDGVVRRRAGYDGNRRRIEQIGADITGGPPPPGSAVLRSASAGSLASAGLGMLHGAGGSVRRAVSPQGKHALGWVLDTHSHLEEVAALKRSHSPVSRQARLSPIDIARFT